MRKLNKGLLLLGAATVTVGMSSLFGIVQPMDKNIEQQELKAYNHSANNILDNVFTRKRDENITNYT